MPRSSDTDDRAAMAHRHFFALLFAVWSDAREAGRRVWADRNPAALRQ